MTKKSLLTHDAINALVIGEQYYHFPHTTTTVAALKLASGFVVVGDSACVHLEDFDEQLGRKLARAKAIDKIWDLEGYRLKNQLPAVDHSTPRSRLEAEIVALDDKLGKLSVFLDTPQFEKLNQQQKMLMLSQKPYMEEYSKILKARLASWEE